MKIGDCGMMAWSAIPPTKEITAGQASSGTPCRGIVILSGAKNLSERPVTPFRVIYPLGQTLVVQFRFQTRVEENDLTSQTPP